MSTCPYTFAFICKIKIAQNVNKTLPCYGTFKLKTSYSDTILLHFCLLLILVFVLFLVPVPVLVPTLVSGPGPVIFLLSAWTLGQSVITLICTVLTVHQYSIVVTNLLLATQRCCLDSGQQAIIFIQSHHRTNMQIFISNV